MADQDIPKWHGILENWSKHGTFYHGRIFMDKKGRFSDGASIRTSPAERVEGALLYTANSIYVLGDPAATS